MIERNLLYREHLEISKREVLQISKPNSTLAFFPTGIMYNLLRLEESVLSVHEISLIGLDFDEGSFLATKCIPESSQYANNIHFVSADAWHLEAFENQFDVLTSYGLNLYVSEESKLIDLYKEFFKVIKPGGILIIRFLSDVIRHRSEFRDHEKSYTLSKVIVDATYRNFGGEASMRYQLEQAGFEVAKVLYRR